MYIYTHTITILFCSCCSVSVVGALGEYWESWVQKGLFNLLPQFSRLGIQFFLCIFGTAFGVVFLNISFLASIPYTSLSDGSVHYVRLCVCSKG